MTNERARANDTAQPVKPVTDWENRETKGLALCGEDVFRDHVRKATALRDRQAAYLDTLPTDPYDALRAALNLMHHNHEEYPAGFKEALSLSFALETLIRDEMTEECPTRNATIYVANRVITSLLNAASQLDRIEDILRNPSRVE